VKTYLFACIHNAGRSQMAAAFFNVLADPRRARAVSAGTSPLERVHPEVVSAMGEVGIDVSGARPQKLTEALARTATVLITMGCGDECPFVPGIRVEDWPLSDPKGADVETVRRIRDQIRDRVMRLIDRDSLTNRLPRRRAEREAGTDD
jgi:arsenate reductase